MLSAVNKAIPQSPPKRSFSQCPSRVQPEAWSRVFANLRIDQSWSSPMQLQAMRELMVAELRSDQLLLRAVARACDVERFMAIVDGAAAARPRDLDDNPVVFDPATGSFSRAKVANRQVYSSLLATQARMPTDADSSRERADSKKKGGGGRATGSGLPKNVRVRKHRKGVTEMLSTVASMLHPRAPLAETLSQEALLATQRWTQGACNCYCGSVFCRFVEALRLGRRFYADRDPALSDQLGRAADFACAWHDATRERRLPGNNAEDDEVGAAVAFANAFPEAIIVFALVKAGGAKAALIIPSRAAPAPRDEVGEGDPRDVVAWLCDACSTLHAPVMDQVKFKLGANSAAKARPASRSDSIVDRAAAVAKLPSFKLRNGKPLAWKLEPDLTRCCGSKPKPGEPQCSGALVPILLTGASVMLHPGGGIVGPCKQCLSIVDDSNMCWTCERRAAIAITRREERRLASSASVPGALDACGLCGWDVGDLVVYRKDLAVCKHRCHSWNLRSYCASRGGDSPVNDDTPRDELVAILRRVTADAKAQATRKQKASDKKRIRKARMARYDRTRN